MCILYTDIQHIFQIQEKASCRRFLLCDSFQQCNNLIFINTIFVNDTTKNIDGLGGRKLRFYISFRYLKSAWW